MAWPPPVLPINRTNATPQLDTHAADHNALALAMNDTVAEVTRVGAQANANSNQTWWNFRTLKDVVNANTWGTAVTVTGTGATKGRYMLSAVGAVYVGGPPNAMWWSGEMRLLVNGFDMGWPHAPWTLGPNGPATLSVPMSAVFDLNIDGQFTASLQVINPLGAFEVVGGSSLIAVKLTGL
jgi:hypothetical protein